MGINYISMARKLQRAINTKLEDSKLIINTSEWYSEQKEGMATQYTVKHASTTNTGKKYKQYEELFHTYSQIQLVLWLRDFWYELNGWEIPHDNVMWERIKERYAKTGQANGSDPSV